MNVKNDASKKAVSYCPTYALTDALTTHDMTQTVKTVNSIFIQDSLVQTEVEKNTQDTRSAAVTSTLLADRTRQAMPNDDPAWGDVEMEIMLIMLRVTSTSFSTFMKMEGKHLTLSLLNENFLDIVNNSIYTFVCDS